MPQFADIDLEESNRNSIYHSLQARFEQRLDFGLSLLASYTFAKSIDNDSSFFSSDGDSNFPQDSYDLRAERGLSNFDVRQRFVASYGSVSYTHLYWTGAFAFGIGIRVPSVFGGSGH